jgi:tetratricopeptide (TPR) repeat protein
MKTRSMMFLVGLLFGCGGALAQLPPLDRAEILGRLANESSPSYIAHLVKIRGVSFDPSGDFLYRVRLAGGEGILIERLSSAKVSQQTASTADADAGYGHLAKCAELVHTGAVESAEKECRAAMNENPRSPWPLVATAQLLQQKSGDEFSGDAVKRTNAERNDLLKRAATLGSNMTSDLEQLDNREFAPGQLGHLVIRDMFSSDLPDPSENISPSDQDVTPDPLLLHRMQIEPDLATNHLTLGVLYTEVRNFDKSQSEFREAIRLEPDNPVGHVIAAYFYLYRHSVDEGLAELREGIRIAPYRMWPRMALAAALETLGRTSDAESELKNLIALHPATKSPSDALIELYTKHKDSTSAITEMRRSLKAASLTFATQEDFVEVRFNDLSRLAQLLDETGDLDAATEEYVFLLHFKPDSAALHNDYGNVFLKKHRFDDALGEYNEAIRLNPDFSTPHHNIAICLMFRNNFDGAVDEFERALKLNPEEPRTYIYLGTALAQKGDLQAATAAFRHAIEQNPDDAQAHVSLAYALGHAGDNSGAILELKEALRLHPEFPTAENDLAWIYATAEDSKLRNPAEALVLARRAVQHSPKPVAAFLDTLAEALLLNGDAAEALAAEERASQADPKSSEIQSRLPRFRKAAQTLALSRP